MTRCALLTCDNAHPANIGVYVFLPGGSYPLDVCSYDHYVQLTYAAPYGVDVVLTKQRVITDVDA